MIIPNKCFYKMPMRIHLTCFAVYLGRDNAMGSVSDVVVAGNI